MKKDAKHLIIAWAVVLVYIVCVSLLLYLTGCKIVGRAAQMEVDNHIDKRARAIVQEQTTGPLAKKIVITGVKGAVGDYAVTGGAIGFGSFASWLAAYFGLKWRKQRVKEN